MTSDANTDPDRSDEVLAAEYVLHLLGPTERAAVETRLAVEGGLRALVARWAEALSDLADGIDPVTPPQRIRAALAQAIAATAPAGRAANAADRVRRSGLSLWRALAGAGLAAALGVMLVTQLPETRLPRPVAADYAGQIVGEDDALLFRVAFVSDTGTLQLDRTAGQAPEGRVLELWMIAEGAAAPLSLGVLPDGPDATVVVPADLRGLIPRATLAISDEPPGGSPTGAPTGSVLAAGGLEAV